MAMLIQDRSDGSALEASGARESGPVRRPQDRKGIRKFLFDIRHRRRRYRQLVGIVFVVLVTCFGRPLEVPFFLGGALALLGMAVRMWASGFVLKNEVLATTGPYAYARHPLYVGNVLICAGFVLASGLWWSAPLALLVLGFFYPQTIHDEDRKLQRLFPEQWDRWASEVRALWPRLLPYRGPGKGEETQWSLRLSMVRNGEPLHALLLLACLVYLFLRL